MAGASEVIYSMLMMKNGFIAGNINFENPDEASAKLNIIPETRETRIDMPIPNNINNWSQEYDVFKNTLADQCITASERLIPHLSKMVTKRYVSTPLTYNRFTLTPDGSAFGIRKDYHNPMMTFLSPRTPLQNLFLTGQSLMLHEAVSLSQRRVEKAEHLSLYH